MQITLLRSAPPKTPIIPHGVIPPLRPLLNARASPQTPWRRIIKKFGLSRHKLASEFGVEYSVLFKHSNSWHGLILPRYQIKILKAAKRLGVKIMPDDMFPCMDDV